MIRSIRYVWPSTMTSEDAPDSVTNSYKWQCWKHPKIHWFQFQLNWIDLSLECLKESGSEKNHLFVWPPSTDG